MTEDRAPELTAEQKATVARFGIHDGGGMPDVRVIRDPEGYEETSA